MRGSTFTYHPRWVNLITSNFTVSLLITYPVINRNVLKIFLKLIVYRHQSDKLESISLIIFRRYANNAYASVWGSIFEFSHGRENIYIFLFLLCHRQFQPIRSRVKLLPVSLPGEHRIGNVSPQRVKHSSLGKPGGLPENQLPTREDDQLHKADTSGGYKQVMMGL